MLQSNRVGLSALAAVPLVGLTLVWHFPWLLALGGIATLLTLLLAWWSRADRIVILAVAGALGLWVLNSVAPLAMKWGNGLVLIGLLVVAAVVTLFEGEPQRGNSSFRQLSLAAMLLSYIGAQATFLQQMEEGATWLSMAEPLAVGVLGGVIFFLIRSALARQYQPLVRRLTLVSTLVYVLYLMLVVSPFWSDREADPRALLAASATLWSLLVGLVGAVSWLPNKALAQQMKAKHPLPTWRVTLNDYLALMKYRVASLLLATTLGAMFIAAQGWPGWSLVGWVMLGGILSVGGAGALNHYLDRDIDGDMGRTSRRPIPSGRMAPWKAFVFGIALSILQFLLFWFKVNPLAAWLSTAGLLYYVVIYTMWLKRTSTQNIVIGGAAGAFPPLVGWAAVAGELSIGALYLFAIIFYWTPPHFWALALMRREDYARAKVPMLPVVRGERETHLQIVLYSLLMIGLTIILVPLRLMGFLYLAIALLLNAKFLWEALHLYRRPSNQAALALYKYSLLYLFLLFSAMAIDRVLLT
ncbi:MAG: heme o synthase [Chloroflexota bacterium]|nr:heme o synthase [Chloroflexota bacterium]